MLPFSHGILSDGTCVHVKWDARRDSGKLIYTVVDTVAPNSGSLKVTIPNEELEKVKSASNEAFIVVTAIFSEGDAAASATVGLGKHWKAESGITQTGGLPAGRYFVVLLVTKAGVPLGAASEAWSATVQIRDGEVTELTLPRK